MRRQQRLARRDHEPDAPPRRRRRRARRPRVSRGRRRRRARRARRRRAAATAARQSPFGARGSARAARSSVRRVVAAVGPASEHPPAGAARLASSRTRRTAWVSRASLRIVRAKRPPAGGPSPMASTSRASSTRAIEAEKPSAAGRAAGIGARPGRRSGTSRSSLRVGDAVCRRARPMTVDQIVSDDRAAGVDALAVFVSKSATSSIGIETRPRLARDARSE